MALLASLASLTVAVPSRAQVPSFDAADDAPRSAPRRVPLSIDAEGAAKVTSGAGTVRCDAPCTVEVEPGFVDVRVGELSQELFVEGPSRVHMSRGVPALRTAGLGMLIAGAAVVIAAVAIPLIVCRSNTTTDATGRPRNNDPCRDIGDGVAVAWISGAGIGLSAAIVGGILFGTTGPKLRVDASAPSGAGLNLRFQF